MATKISPMIATSRLLFPLASAPHRLQAILAGVAFATFAPTLPAHANEPAAVRSQVGAPSSNARQTEKYPNLGMDISWIPATSEFHKSRDFSRVPGVVVAHSPEKTGICLGSPSLVVLPGGTYVASHDFSGRRWPEKDGTSVLIYQSKDKGATWACVSRVNNQDWSTLFWHRGALYLIGCGLPENGFVVRQSTDKGVTWTEPRHEKSGLENQHNSNFITFHRVRDFRNRTLKTEPLTGELE